MCHEFISSTNYKQTVSKVDNDCTLHFHIGYSILLKVRHCHLFFLCFTTYSCTSCTSSPFSIFHYTAVLQVYCHLFFSVWLHTAVLHVHCPLFFIFHYTELYFMYIVTSFLCFTTHSCTSCTLSPLFYVSLQSWIHVHGHPFFMFHYTELYFHVHFHLFFLFHYTQSCPSCTLSPLFLCFTTAFWCIIPLFYVSLHHFYVLLYNDLFYWSKFLSGITVNSDIVWLKIILTWLNIF